MRLSSFNRGRSTPTVFVSKSSSKENLKSKRGGLSKDSRFRHPNLPLPLLSNDLFVCCWLRGLNGRGELRPVFSGLHERPVSLYKSPSPSSSQKDEVADIQEA
ncbi:hypothetical protein MA16_Dca006123 [Dendrobium catenatum]|uniref:Uncharacterized protein n=1 Tax=Dendrobium catenatum TaxID=906689 RepID=A0A2I0X4I8_9ASPA|nr:hypothetical protein MA16_Dca006123 [Dendrobium catenatum]